VSVLLSRLFLILSSPPMMMTHRAAGVAECA
jgi:hypothetical protein